MTLEEQTPSTRPVDIGEDCVGCYACECACPHDAITLSADSKGFLYPEVDSDRCVECGLCATSCPVLSPPRKHPLPRAYACAACEDGLRECSSSGGVFGLLARQVVEAEGVVFGAAFDEYLEVMHVRAESHGQLAHLRGSKYVQSRTGSTYTEVRDALRADRRVLFSGTPCQVAGLKSFLRGDYAGLLCVDLVCHGVPSPRVWRRYMRFQEDRHGARIIEASFRNKKEGWMRSQDLLLKFDNGVGYRETPVRDPYMTAFLRDICLRPSCYACRFRGLERPSDITLADFWGIQNIAPEMDDDKGTSFVLVHSEAGRAAIDTLEQQQELRSVAVLAADAIEYNPPAVRSAAPHPKSAEFYRDLESVPFDRLVRKNCHPSLVRRVLGRMSRVARQMVPRRVPGSSTAVR